MGRPKLSQAEKDARKLARQAAKKEPSTEDIMAKIAHAQSQTPDVLPPEEAGTRPEITGISDDLKNNADEMSSAEPGENDPDYEARMIEKIEHAMAAARAQTMDTLKPKQIKITPLSASTSEVQIIGNQEMKIEDSGEEDTRPDFVKADD